MQCAGLPPCKRHWPLYPRGPRSGPSYIVSVHHHLVGPIRPTRQHSTTSSQSDLYARPSLCPFLGPRRPASGSELSLIVLYRPVALWDPGMSIGWMHPVPSPTTLAYRPLGKVSALPTSPTLRFSWGGTISGLYYGSLSLRPADLFALLSELTRLSPCQRGLVLPGFRRFGRPRRRRI